MRAIAGVTLLTCLLSFTVLSREAEAKESHRAAYIATLSLLGAGAIGCLAASLAFRLVQPGADTLMTWKRDGNLSDGFAIGGALTLAPTLMFAVLGRVLLDVKKEPHALAPVPFVMPGGGGLALGGTF